MVGAAAASTAASAALLRVTSRLLPVPRQARPCGRSTLRQPSALSTPTSNQLPVVAFGAPANLANSSATLGEEPAAFWMHSRDAASYCCIPCTWRPLIFEPRAIRSTNTPRYGAMITNRIHATLATPLRSELRKMSNVTWNEGNTVCDTLLGLPRPVTTAGTGA